MTTHYLIGGSGIPNYGDELIASAWIAFIEGKHPTDSIVLDVKNRKASMEIVRSGPNVTHVSSLKDVAHTKSASDVWGNIRRGLGFIDNNGFKKYEKAAPLRDAMDDLGTFHVFGGGYINTRWPAAAFYLGLGVAVKEKTGAKLFASGLGLMPWLPPETEAERELAARVAEAFDVLEVRDQASADAFGAPITAGLDDVFLLPTPQRQAGLPPTLHISLTFAEKNWEGFADRLVGHVAQTYAPAFQRVTFWNNAPDKDAFALKKVREAIPQVEVIEIGDLVNAPLPFGEDDAMVTTRFHPHMMAARAGIPGLYRQGNSYYMTKHGSVALLGSGMKPVEMKNLPNVLPTDRGTLHARDAELRAQKLALAERIYG